MFMQESIVIYTVIGKANIEIKFDIWKLNSKNTNHNQKANIEIKFDTIY